MYSLPQLKLHDTVQGDQAFWPPTHSGPASPALPPPCIFTPDAAPRRAILLSPPPPLLSPSLTWAALASGLGVGLCFTLVEFHLVKAGLTHLLHLLHICVCVFKTSSTNSNTAFVWVISLEKKSPCPTPGPGLTPAHLGETPWRAAMAAGREPSEEPGVWGWGGTEAGAAP